jgi:glutamate dehydrogenase
MLNRVGSTFVHRLMETTGAGPHEVVRAYLLSREVFGFVALWKAIEALDNKVDDALQSAMLIDMSRELERGTTWFLRSRRLGEDMAATIAHFAPRVEALAAGLPALLDAPGRARIGAAVGEHVAKGVPEALAGRVVTLDSLYLTLDIVEVAGATTRPVELVAEIYFELSTRLELPWLRAMIGRLPGEAHWQLLARTAMGDDLSGLQRSIAVEVLSAASGITTRDELLASWQERNRRATERARRLLDELRAAPATDASMLAVALRELRNLG